MAVASSLQMSSQEPNTMILLDLEVNSGVQLRELTIPAAKKIKVSSGQRDVTILFPFLM
ncbi:hypothetical protein GH733_001801 [Mirounga leonina]|nr:hypothetical protein GH733_001801 [Mirounga leonina]